MTSHRWSGKPTPKGWTSTRRRILKRDSNECQMRIPGVCVMVATETDHIIPDYLGGSDEDENLRAVCKPCHAQKTKAEKTAVNKRRSAPRPTAKHPGLIR